MPRDRRQELLINRRQRLLLADQGGGGGPAADTQAALEALSPLLLYTFSETSGGALNSGSLSGTQYNLTNEVGTPVYQQATKDEDPPAGKAAIHFDGNTVDEALWVNAGTNYSALGTAMGTAGHITIGFAIDASVDNGQLFGIVKGGALGGRFQITVLAGTAPVRLQAYNSSNVAQHNGSSNHQGLGDSIPHMITLVQPGDGTGCYFIVDGKVDAGVISVGGAENFWFPNIASEWTNMIVGGQSTSNPPTLLADETQGQIEYLAVCSGAVDEAAIIAIHDRFIRNVDMVVGNSGASEGYAPEWSNSSISQQPIEGQTLTGCYVNGSSLFVINFGGANITAGAPIYARIEGANNNNRYTLTWSAGNSRYQLTNQPTLAAHLLANLGNTLKLRITTS